MSIPQYYEFFETILISLRETNKSTKELVSDCKKVFNITEEDAKKEYKGGKNILLNRVGWARTYLNRAGLIYYPSRGISSITAEGLNALQPGVKVDLEYLNKIDSFVEFKNKRNDDLDINIDDKSDLNMSPEEMIDKGLSLINNDIKADLKTEILEIDPYQFERLVVDLIVKMGYGHNNHSGQVTKKTGDGGVDGVINMDSLGLEKIYIQAKQYKGTTVGDREIKNFVGSMKTDGITKGIFITTSTFTSSAIDTANKNRDIKIILIDIDKLIDLMYEYNLGIQKHEIIEIKKIDSDYFSNLIS